MTPASRGSLPRKDSSYEDVRSHRFPDDPRFGRGSGNGLFYHVVKHEGRSWPHYGRFIRLDRGRTIEHTWVSEATHGLETLVTIALAPNGDATDVTLHHANVPAGDMGRGHRDGWTWYLDVLGQRFERVAAR